MEKKDSETGKMIVLLTEEKRIKTTNSEEDEFILEAMRLICFLSPPKRK